MRKKKAGRLIRNWRVSAATLVAALLMASLWMPAAQKKNEKQPAPNTLILVSAFAETGQTLRGASLRLTPADKDGKPVKGKKQSGFTNNMGEYPFHVPKTEAHYVLRAEAKGFEPVEKVVSVSGEDQVDIFLRLPPKK